MPTIKEIVMTEQNKPQGTVVLFEEGLFAKAYEESAWRLALRFGLKPTLRHVKAAGMDVVSVGFPLTGLRDRLPEAERDGAVWRARLSVDDGASTFAGWKAALPQQGTTQPTAAPQGVAEALRAFPLENSTPLECMLFVARLKQQVKV